MKPALGALVLIALVCGLPFYLTFSPSWEDRAYEFPNSDGDFRVRVIESHGRACAQLKQHRPHNEIGYQWSIIGQDCAWPAVTGDAWLAGGQTHRITDSSSTTVATANWLFYGIVPEAAAEVRLTLSSGATVRIPTRPAGKDGQRVYAHQELNAGQQITVTGLQLRDTADGEISVY